MAQLAGINRKTKAKYWDQHPTKYFVINGKEKVDKIMEIIVEYLKFTDESPEILPELEKGNNMVMGKASALILAYVRNNTINPSVDTAFALDYTELILQSKGIGTCWTGYSGEDYLCIPERGCCIKQWPLL